MNYQDFQAPNLDGCSNDELRKWQEIFLSLNRYAGAKIWAHEYRVEGLVADALQTEAVCERIYESLPKDVRW